MLPNEVQILIAKILFFLFSITIICQGQGRACEKGADLFGSSRVEKIIVIRE
jgi:hypothetical protein